MTDRTETLRLLMRRVHRAMAKSAPALAGTRSFPSVTLTLPGFTTAMEIEGVDVRDLLVPDVPVPASRRLTTLMGLLPYLGDPALTAASRTALRSKVGRLVLDFTLLADSPAGRFTRLLWAFGKGTEPEIDTNTLIIRDESGEYGVRDGIMVGGLYEGTPLDLPVSAMLRPDISITTRSASITEIRRVLRSREDPEVFNIFCLLYAISAWDSTVIIDTLLMPKPRRVARQMDKLSKEILTHHDPYRHAYRALVPYFMTYSDFVAIFGRPENRGNLRADARTRLINKLYMLPFFD